MKKTITAVATDNDTGGVMVGEKLAELGSEVFFLGAVFSLPTVQARLRGLKTGLNNKSYKLTDDEIIIQGKKNDVVAMKQNVPTLSGMALELMKRLIDGEKIEEVQHIVQPEISVRRIQV